MSIEGYSCPTGRGALSGRQLALRSGQQLARLGAQLQALERLYLSATTGLRPADMQALDVLFQQIHGISIILSEAAAFLPDEADPRLERLLALPRLQLLADALLGQDIASVAEPSTIELF